MQSMLQQMYVRFQIDIRTVGEECMQLLLVDISRLCGDIRTQKEHITGGIRKNIIPGKQFLIKILILGRLTTYQGNYTNKIVAIKKERWFG